MQTITSTAAWMKLLMLKPAALEAIERFGRIHVMDQDGFSESATIGTARDESLFFVFLNVQKEGLLFMFNMGVSQNETNETHGKPTVFFFLGGGGGGGSNSERHTDHTHMPTYHQGFSPSEKNPCAD